MRVLSEKEMGEVSGGCYRYRYRYYYYCQPKPVCQPKPPECNPGPVEPPQVP